MAFSLQPAANANPVTPAEVPNFIQFRVNGVNLGGPDATTVNFAGGMFTVERGTGADANKITVSLNADVRVTEDGTLRAMEGA